MDVMHGCECPNALGVVEQVLKDSFPPVFGTSYVNYPQASKLVDEIGYAILIDYFCTICIKRMKRNRPVSLQVLILYITREVTELLDWWARDRLWLSR